MSLNYSELRCYVKDNRCQYGACRFYLVGVATEKPSRCIMMFKCDLRGVVIASYILKRHKCILFLHGLSIDKYDMFRLLAIIP